MKITKNWFYKLSEFTTNEINIEDNLIVAIFDDLNENLNIEIWENSRLEFYSIIERWLKDMGYDKDDYTHEYNVFEEGKVIKIELRPYRSVSDYVKLYMKINIVANNLKDVIVKIDEKDTQLQDGNVSVVFAGFVITDYEKRWVSNALSYFFRVIIDKYLYSGYIRNFEKLMMEDINLLYEELSSYLNLNKYRFGKV